MRDAFRLFASFVVFLATYYFVYWVPFSFLPFLHQNGVAIILSLLCAIGAARYTWKQMGSMPDGLGSTILSGAMTVGAIGFCGGFFGPIVFTPEANQGPLLGIFITGPLGFILGGVCGLVYWLTVTRTSQDQMKRGTL
ncbi:MAG TPA: hypothetical protein VKB81_05910 [Nitrospira sp.]|nr:hypothetical protein [Nitrospira sp.]